MKAATVADEASFVTIGIDREVFAVPVETVIEILDMRPVFRIPEAPPYFKGLIDLRGRAIPVIDLRTKPGLPTVAADHHTRIIVLEVPMETRTLALGLVADRVYEVITLDRQQIEAAPDIGSRWNSDYICGIARRHDSFVVLVDLPKLFLTDAAHLLSMRANLPPAGGDGPSSASQAA